jgi:hypothetical protein
VAAHTARGHDAAAAVLRADLTELRMLKAPPQHTVDTLRTALALLNEDAPLDWERLRKECSDQKFVARLKDFDPSSISPEAQTLAISLADERPAQPAAGKVHTWIKCMLAANLRVSIIPPKRTSTEFDT